MLSNLYQIQICFSLRSVIQIELKSDGHSAEESSKATCSSTSLNTAVTQNGAVTDFNVTEMESDTDKLIREK
jgi:hypothetical protein